MRVSAVKKEPGYKEEYIYGKVRTSMALVQSGVPQPKRSSGRQVHRGHNHSVNGRFSSIVMRIFEQTALQIAWLALAEEDEGVYTGGRQPETEA